MINRPIATLRQKTRVAVVSSPIGMELTIANESTGPLTVVEPEVGIPPPDLHWTASADAYRIGVLTSYGWMQIALKDAGGAPVAGKAPTPWVTPLMGTRVLRMHERLTLDFDLNELFAIDSPGNYLVSARFGREGASCTAATHLEIVPSSLDLPHE